MNKNAIALPSLKGDTKLPVFLNHKELKELFATPTLLKQRVVLTLIYSGVLRGKEVVNLKTREPVRMQFLYSHLTNFRSSLKKN